jgi:ketosteroid isomerase-like protein
MRRGYVVVVALLLLAAPWPAVGQEKPVKADSSLPSERARVEQTIHDNICWALTKDRALLERTMVHDASLFIFNPDSKPTIGWDELAKNFVFWMDPRFKAVSCDIRDLRVSFSPSGDAARWSAILDDLAEWDGKPAGWKDTRWTGVLEKRNGTWLIVQMHFSFASDRVRAETLEAVKKQAAGARK